MNRAAVIFQERALLVRRLAEAHLVGGPVDILFFERLRGHFDEAGGTLQVVFI
jgi:hypothetical protein